MTHEATGETKNNAAQIAGDNTNDAANAADIHAEETQKKGELSDGRTFEVKKGKGKHAMNATRISGGKEEKFIPALITQLTLINGNKIVIEDLEEMPMQDYLTISAEFATKNF